MSPVTSDPQPGHSAPGAAAPHRGEQAAIDILLVDDDSTLRNGLAEALRRSGYSLLTAANGKAAVELLSTHRFRLLITDIYMPVNDGLEVIMQNQSMCTGTPVIAMSGGGALGAAETVLRPALNLGCCRTIEKPFDLPELIGAVREALG